MERPAIHTGDARVLRVLVADDEAVIRGLLVDFLAAEGYEVSGACDGLEAVAALETRPFDLVITDLMMPGLSGVEVLRAARRIDPNYPVIVITGYPSRRNAEELLALGASDFLAKPFNLDAVRGTVSSLMGVRHRTLGRPTVRG